MTNPTDTSATIDTIFAFGYEDPAFIHDIHVLIGGEARVEEAKAALSAMVAEIIGEDEDRNHRYNKNWQTEVDAQNYLREQQRQRAIAKGFTL